MLCLPEEQREALWRYVAERVERYCSSVETLPVAPRLDVDSIRRAVKAIDFNCPLSPEAAVDFAADGLTRHQVHTSHPQYWGLFNPAPATMGIAADTLVAAFNPQIAAWSHSPFAAEVEAELVERLGRLFGLSPRIDGVLTSGGMEANHTALLAALTHAFPSYPVEGVRSLPGQPVFYVSSEAHHSFAKSARLCGIGMNSMRPIPVDGNFRMKQASLERQIFEDCRAGFIPFAVVGTAGTTNAGAIDPLRALANVAHANDLWFHVDAAWGGGAAFVPELRPVVDGIERADSITFDAHKWLSVPMGAGVFLTSDPEILHRTFRVPTSYMPKEAADLDVVDPHLHSMQWSRRFIGLKIFLSLAVAGWRGYESAIRHQTAMGALLRHRLCQEGWIIANRTELPVVCFVQPNASAPQMDAMVRHVLASGQAWISTTVLAGADTVMRACVTHYGSQPEHIEALVDSLGAARQAVCFGSAASA